LNYIQEKKNDYIGEGSEEATIGGWGDLGGVDGADHEGVADADSGDETAEHEKRIVGGETHENCSGEEDGAGEDNGVSAAYPVGGSAGQA